jgi:CheY-like chemotaxis protein
MGAPTRESAAAMAVATTVRDGRRRLWVVEGVAVFAAAAEDSGARARPTRPPGRFRPSARTWPAAPRPAGSAPTVLLVDDNDMMRQAMRGLLEDAGCVVVDEAAGEEQALAKAEALAPDVVLMDIRLAPFASRELSDRHGGLHATERIRRLRAAPQVVILTLMEGAWLDDRGRAAGAFEVLRKGCPPELILDTVFAAWRARRNELEDR